MTATVTLVVDGDSILTVSVQMRQPNSWLDETHPMPLCSVRLGTGEAVVGSPAELRRLASACAEAADKGDALAHTTAGAA